MEIIDNKDSYILLTQSDREAKYFNYLCKKDYRDNWIFTYAQIEYYPAFMHNNQMYRMFVISKRDLKKLKEYKKTLIESYINHILYFQNNRA